MSVGEGERLEAERRRKFWRTILALCAAGAVGGFLSGFLHGKADATGQPMDPVAAALALAAVAIAVVGGLIASWRFFQTADEVEVSDNLWASLVGFYVYGFSLPAWWGLSMLGIVPEPNHWVIYAISMISAGVTYAGRKWRAR